MKHKVGEIEALEEMSEWAEKVLVSG